MRTTPYQFQTMLAYMERHGDLNKMTFGGGPRARIEAENKWQELAKALNKVRYSARSANQWKKTWSDWKNNVKKKVKKIIMSKRKHESSILTLTPLEIRLLKLIRHLVPIKKPSLEHNKLDKPEAVNDQVAEPDDTELQVLDETSPIILDDDADPLPDIKQENLSGDEGENTFKDFDVIDVLGSSAGLVEECAPVGSPSHSDDPVQEKPQDSNDIERKREREEELHKLRVAERLWALRILRERHSTMQQEKEWQLKAQRERHAAARLARERAQLQRDLALLMLRRAERDTTHPAAD